MLVLAGCGEPAELRFGGYIEAEKIEVGSRVGGRVEAVFVDEGDEVASGTVLVRFETVHQKAQLAEAQHRASRLKTTLEKLEAGPRKQEIEVARQQLTAATEQFQLATANYDRAVTTGQFTSIEERQRLETAMNVARSQEQARREELSLLEEGTRAEDLVIARRELQEAEARVVDLRDQLAEGEVKAPADTVVEAFDLEAGDLVAGGAPIATLVRKDELWVRCFVPATQLTFVRPAQKVKVTVDSRAGKQFEGKVLRINRVAEYTPRNVQTFDQREDQVFGVKVGIKDPGGVLRPGMAATVVVERAG